MATITKQYRLKANASTILEDVCRLARNLYGDIVSTAHSDYTVIYRESVGHSVAIHIEDSTVRVVCVNNGLTPAENKRYARAFNDMCGLVETLVSAYDKEQ